MLVTFGGASRAGSQTKNVPVNSTMKATYIRMSMLSKVQRNVEVQTSVTECQESAR